MKSQTLVDVVENSTSKTDLSDLSINSVVKEASYFKRIKRIAAGILSAVVLTWAVFAGPVYATVKGRCDNCHTMHYSQGGGQLAGWGTEGPYNTLLLNTCLGCHTTPTSGDAYDGTTPFVTGTDLTDNACLAGGVFPAVMGTGDNDDNHHGMGNKNAPAGYDGTFYTGVADGLSCAGTNGCHGNETDTDDMKAIKGGHHDTTLAFRMLYVDGDSVEGDGAADYEEAMIKDPTTTVATSGVDQNVNIYCAGTPSVATKATISELCAKCHGVFHGAGTGSASPWVRHPTENIISSGWEIGSGTYVLDGDDYKNNPVGFDAAVIDNAEKRVTCLSCHRAHGTDNDDILKWAYSTQQANTTNEFGCLGCHDTQRGPDTPQ